MPSRRHFSKSNWLGKHLPPPRAHLCGWIVFHYQHHVCWLQQLFLQLNPLNCMAMIKYFLLAEWYVYAFSIKLMLPPNYGGGIMVNALGLGSSPCSGHCVLFLGKVLTCNFHSASLRPVPGLTLWWTSIPSRGVEILLITSCYRNGDTLWFDVSPG